MKNTVMVFMVLFLLGCQAVQKPQPPAQAVPAEPQKLSVGGEPTQVVVTPSSEAVPDEVPPAPLENIPVRPEEGFDIGRACYDIIDSEGFSSVCGNQGRVVVTPKMSDAGCWVNIADQANSRLTAGFTVVEWKNSAEANEEFERGVRMRKTQGAMEGKAVGERNYEYEELERHNVVWVRDAFLTRLGAMNELCPKEKLVELAKKIDQKLH